MDFSFVYSTHHREESSLKFRESFFRRFSCALRHLDDVECDGLGQRSALADGDDVARGHVSEARTQMRRDVLVALLEPVQRETS